MEPALWRLLSTVLLGVVAGILPIGAQGRDEAGPGKHEHPAHEHGGDDIGRPGSSQKVTRVIRVTMNDAMRFSPAYIAVKRGEVIRFNVVNTGKLKHEMVIGSAAFLQEHAKLMQRFPEMEHAEPNQVTVPPGKSGVVIWQFDTAGTVNFACLQPGHFEAGMKGAVQVAD